jgi:CheY-like chemotaxis protein
MSTVLILDDEYLVADILSFALEDEGILTVTTGRGQKALEILDRERPDLIVTDFMMPGMTGVEFAEAVRTREAHRDTPIILMSGAHAHLGSNHPDLFIDVLEKPFEIAVFISKVKAVLKLEG